MKLVRGPSHEFDAHFEVERSEGGWDIVLHARSGARGSSRALNTEYAPALEVLLGRLARRDVVVRTVSVDSRQARALPPEERVLDLAFPIRLGSATDIHELRTRLTEAQRPVARRSTTRTSGGNNHKRIRISTEGLTNFSTSEEVALFLSGKRHEDADGSQVGMPYRAAASDPRVRTTEVFGIDVERRERALASHARTQNLLADFLRRKGIAPRSPAAHEPDFDIAWEIGETAYVAEVKSLMGGNQARQLRLGLGQVLHYRFELAQLRHPVRAVLAVERPPAGLWQELGATVDVVVTWPDAWPGL